MRKFFNEVAEYGQTIITTAPVLAATAAYAVSRDPQFAAFTFMVTSMGAPEMSGHLTLAQEGYKNAAPRM